MKSLYQYANCLVDQSGQSRQACLGWAMTGGTRLVIIRLHTKFGSQKWSGSGSDDTGWTSKKDLSLHFDVKEKKKK